MIKSELNFSVKVKSSETEPLDIKVEWKDDDTNKLFIFGKERSKAIIASIIEEILFSHMQCGDWMRLNQALDTIENAQSVYGAR